jgi:hypothetical protein
MSKQSEISAPIKKNLLKITDILVGLGISIYSGPPGKMVYELSKLAVKEFSEEKNSKRFQKFHEALLTGDLKADEIEIFVDKDIDAEDYYILLKHAIQDDEDRKTNYYAELLRKIALKQVPEEYKFHLMKIAKELTFFEIELVRKIYIYKMFRLIPSQGPVEHLSSLLSSNDFQVKSAIESIIRLGILERIEQDFKVTDFALITAQALFKESELIPSSIGKKVWNQSSVLIIAPQEVEYSIFSTKVQLIMRECCFQPGAISLIHPEFSERVKTIHSSILILVIGKTDHAGFSNLQEIDNMMKSVEIPSSVNVVKVMVDIDGSPFDDFLPTIQSHEVVHCSLNNLQSFDNLAKSLALTE